ncbi:MAG: hypothetical protein WKG07_38290 [Hymenobacter sp.]
MAKGPASMMRELGLAAAAYQWPPHYRRRHARYRDDVLRRQNQQANSRRAANACRVDALGLSGRRRQRYSRH